VVLDRKHSAKSAKVRLTLSKPAWHHIDVAPKHRSKMALAGKAAIERDLHKRRIGFTE
jgi:hypothetical protein